MVIESGIYLENAGGSFWKGAYRMRTTEPRVHTWEVSLSRVDRNSRLLQPSQRRLHTFRICLRFGLCFHRRRSEHLDPPFREALRAVPET